MGRAGSRSTRELAPSVVRTATDLGKQFGVRADVLLDELVDMRNVALTWDQLDEIRSWAPLPLVLKGVMTGEDARLAVDHGADAVWVSNHGGRQLDRVQAPVEVLSRGRRRRRGPGRGVPGRRRPPRAGRADRARAGRHGRVHARPLLWALACAGEPGVVHGLRILKEELARALALVGAAPRRGGHPRSRSTGRARLGPMTEALPVDPALVDEAAALEPRRPRRATRTSSSRSAARTACTTRRTRRSSPTPSTTSCSGAWSRWRRPTRRW